MKSKYSSSLLLVAGLVAVVGLASVAEADHSWGGYHWARSSNPLVLNIGDNVGAAWDDYLGTASSDWSVSSDVLDTTLVAGGTSATKGRKTPKNCIPTSGRVEVCDAGYGNTGWLGIASIWASGTHITQGTVKMNDTYFNTSTYNTPAWRHLVMCQEIGHTFGLDHQDEIFDNANLGTCMDYTNDPSGLLYNNGVNNEHPNTHDYDELAFIYSHTDTTTTATQTTTSRGNQEIDHSDPSTWGKEIRRDSRGNTSLFERDFGGGEKAFTFVTWAE